MSNDTPMTFEIRSEARGPHWIAWAATRTDPKPWRSVVLVGQTQKEAEARARRWIDEQGGQLPQNP